MTGFIDKIKNNKTHRRAMAAVLTLILLLCCFVGFYGSDASSGVGVPDSGGDTMVVNCLIVMPDYKDNVYKYYKNLVTDRVKQALPGYTVNVKGMCSWELNCSNADLSTTFDYIYVAAYDTAAGETEPYIHTGEQKTVITDVTGQNLQLSYYTQEEIDSVYAYFMEHGNTKQNPGQYEVRTSYPGNDLTARKVEEMKKFFALSESGKVIEFGDAFVQSIGSGASGYEQYIGSPSTESASETNVAHLYKWVSDRGSLMEFNSVEGTERLAHIRDKMKIEIEEQPVSIDEGFANSAGESAKLLEYKFRIKDNGFSGHNYTMQFITDNNADGRFDPDNEQVGNVTIKLASDLRQTVEPDQLKADTLYALTINAGESVGLFEWQMKIYDNAYFDPAAANSDNAAWNIKNTRENGNPVGVFRYASEMGVCKLQLGKNQPKEKIRVLQLMSSGTSSISKNLIELPNEEESARFRSVLASHGMDIQNQDYGSYSSLDALVKGVSGNAEMKSELGLSAAIDTVKFEYYCYFEGLTEYGVTVSRAKASELPGMVRAWSADGSADTEAVYTYLTKNYDMLIFGFGDRYADNTEKPVLEGVEEYIRAGKAVLFCHDTVGYNSMNLLNSSGIEIWKAAAAGYGLSRVNVTDKYWGYNINHHFRDMLGMDRFGVTRVDQDVAQYTDLASRTAAAAQEFELANKVQIAEDKDYNHSTYYAVKDASTTSRVAAFDFNESDIAELGDSEEFTVYSPEGQEYRLTARMSSASRVYIGYSDGDALQALSQETDENGETCMALGLTPSYWIRMKNGKYRFIEAKSYSEDAQGYDRVDDLTYYHLAREQAVYSYVTEESGILRYANQGKSLRMVVNTHDTVGNARLMNNGPITTYPYDVVKNADSNNKKNAYQFFQENKGMYDIRVANTHSQYWQLDLENDDIVVWYSLYNTSGNSEVYHKHPMDGRNLYFLYSKGNITYSGVGHSAAAGKLNEVKLFVNTFVSSYRSANSGVSMEVLNWDAERSAEGNYSLSVDYLGGNLNGTASDDTSTSGSGSTINSGDGTTASGTDIVSDGNQQYKRMYFRIRDNTVSANKEMTVNFYRVDSVPGQSSPDPAGSPLAYYGNKIYRSSDGEAVANTDLKALTEYYIYIPVSDISSEITVQCNIKMVTWGTGSVNKKTTNYYTYVTMNNERWFNLG
ncbi:MAG: DUF5057 domain-containing protein [Clostridia bacterium]|nr:DUF5057 domain-containing protein [Clostridia bacterium]